MKTNQEARNDEAQEKDWEDGVMLGLDVAFEQAGPADFRVSVIPGLLVNRSKNDKRRCNWDVSPVQFARLARSELRQMTGTHNEKRRDRVVLEFESKRRHKRPLPGRETESDPRYPDFEQLQIASAVGRHTRNPEHHQIGAKM